MAIKRIQIAPVVAEILGRCTVQGDAVILPEGHIDNRDLYLAVDKVLKALGGKWNKGRRAHIFAAGLGEQLTEALAAGHVVDQKKTLEQFFTPEALAERMASLAGIGPGMHVLEPSAGDGRLVRAALAAGAAFISAVEIDPKLAEVLGQFMWGQHAGGVFCDNFLSWWPPSPIPIDVVLMNPPFSANQDIAHFYRAFELLRPGGVIVALMSPHWRFAEDHASQQFRAHMINGDAVIEDVPEGTFKESGTGIRTVMVRMVK